MGSRGKGRRGENAFAKYLGGQRISVPGLPGPDVRDANGLFWEVKVGKQIPKKNYQFIEQAEQEGAVGVAMKGHYQKKWLLVFDADRFFDEWERKT